MSPFSTERMDGPVVVVGGGIVGSAIAFELQKRGIDTILVERDIDPQGASAYSFASLTAFDEPLRDVYLLKTLGIVGWRRLAKELGDDIGVRWDGEIHWAENREAAITLSSQMERAAGRGYPVRSIPGRTITELLPSSTPRDVLAATFAPEDGQADPVSTIDALRGAFVERGGTLLVGRASLLFEEEGVQVRVGEDQIDASRVVIAAGAETAALLGRFGCAIPMDASPGMLVLTTPTEPIVTGTVYVSPSSGTPIHLRQLPDGRVLIGERGQDEVAGDATMRHAQKLLRQAQVSFPALAEVDVDRSTVEWRPMPRDRKPIVGAIPVLPTLYVAAAHSGVTIAPALGELVAHELIEHERSPRLEAFRPTRFAEHEVDVHRSVEEAFAAPPEVFIG